MMKHRAELSGVVVIDNDGGDIEEVYKRYPTCRVTFHTTTSSRNKQHFYLFPPEGLTFTPDRKVKTEGTTIDVLSNGIIFEGHDYQSENTHFSMSSAPIYRCTIEEYESIEALNAKKIKKTPKPTAPAASRSTNHNTDDTFPASDDYNAQNDAFDLLQRYGYRQIGNRLIHPDSDSGTAGVFQFESGKVLSYGGDWLNDGRPHDCFDIYAHYEHNDDKKAAYRALAGESMTQPAPQPNKPSEEHAPKTIAWHHFNDLAADTTPTEWLVEEMIGVGEWAFFYGQTGSYKSFLMIDLGQKVARGEPWCGRKTKQGVVIYLAGEGHKGIRKRAAAYNNRWGKSDAEFYISDRGSNLADPVKTQELAASIKQLLGDRKAAMIIIDTLHRNTAGLQENSADDWGAIQSNVDTYLRDLTDAICPVHHTGKDQTKGMRGSGSMEADTDGAFLIQKWGENGCRLSAEKVKESERGWQIFFKTHKVAVSDRKNYKDETESSLIIEEDADSTTTTTEPLGQPQKDAQQLARFIRMRLQEHPEDRVLDPSGSRYGLLMGGDGWESTIGKYKETLNTKSEGSKKNKTSAAKKLLLEEEWDIDKNVFFHKKDTTETYQ